MEKRVRGRERSWQWGRDKVKRKGGGVQRSESGLEKRESRYGEEKEGNNKEREREAS